MQGGFPGGCRGCTSLLALARWGAGEVQFFMIKQKNIRDIINEIHIILYSNLSTLKCSNLKYSDMIMLVSQVKVSIKTSDLLQSVQWYYFHYYFSPLDV